MESKTDISNIAAEMRQQALDRFNDEVEQIATSNNVEANDESRLRRAHSKYSPSATKYAYTVQDALEVQVFGFVLTREGFGALVFIVSLSIPVILVEVFGLELHQLRILGSLVMLGIPILASELLLQATFASLANRRINSLIDSSSKECKGAVARKISIVLVYLADLMAACIFGLGGFSLAYFR